MITDAFPDALRAALDQDPCHVPEAGDRLAAVLVPVLTDAGYALVFTERPESMSRHAGQVAFPGGLLHDGETPVEAALRETYEEIGLPPEAVEVLGALAPVHTVVSGILVVPFVGLIRGRPVFTPNEGEIAGVFEVPMEQLMATERAEEWDRGGRRFSTFVYEVCGRTIWGATAHMLHDLLRTVRSP